MTRSLRTSAVALHPSSPAVRETGRASIRPNPLDGRGRSRASARAAHGFARAPGLTLDLDPFDLRAVMAERWGAWVRRQFRRPEEAAVAFGVTHQCARNWFDGLHRPAGETVLMAVSLWGPAFTAHMMGEV
ncbi:hypothetical protein [Frigidibacter sp. MR17.24]|uniref:hypothetical protein n=1 Tax=Frigidibacter sp. MR17.24 TaxID=3127345 RepID=UPI0030131E2F